MQLFHSVIFRRARWTPVLLALAPALGATTSGLGALVVAAITLALGAICGALVLVLRRALTPFAALLLVVIAAVTGVTLAELWLGAEAAELRGELGVFVPLITVNVLVLGQATLVGATEPLRWYGRLLAQGVAFATVLVLIGLVRELLGTGAVFGAPVAAVELGLFMAPAGALLLAGLAVAGARALLKRVYPGLLEAHGG